MPPHTPPEFYAASHSASQSQPPLYAGTPTLTFDYDNVRNSDRSPPSGASSPYTPRQPFASYGFHPTPQFTHAHSPFPAHHAQHSQRPQFPPSYTYMARASPAASEDTRQTQQQQPSTWWFIPPHSASPTTGPYPNMYYVNAYGNPSNPSLGPGFQPLPSPSSSRPLQTPAFTLTEPAGPDRPSEGLSKPESTPSSQDPLSLSQSPFALEESVSERGHRQPQQVTQTRRRSHLPNPPAQRSEWVMWVGNVPSDATHDELWHFFTRSVTPGVSSLVEARFPYQQQQIQQQPHLPAGLLSPSGSSSTSDANPANASCVQSVFLISRSNCAFVNYASAEHLAAAVQQFNGIPLRPGDPRCPRLVCRVRGKEEDQRAGVGGQRGTGIHTRWIREQRERDAAREQEEKQARRRQGALVDGDTSTNEPPGTPSSAVLTESGTESSTHGSGRRAPHHSSSSGSTTSGFLARYFPKRYFILKSLTQADLDISVKKGVWATQPHNETVLNQAFRNSSDVFLIFSVNKSGEFFGYARMAGPIGKASDRVSWASRTDSQHSHSPAASFTSSVVGKGSQVSETIPEENEGSSPEGNEGDTSREKGRESEKERRSYMLFSPSEHRLADDSPQPVTPSTQERLTKAEEAGKGKILPSAERNTAPPSDGHYDRLKAPLTESSGTQFSGRPTSTSAPAVMGPPYRKITNPRIQGLGSETIDPRIFRHHPPDIQLDYEAPRRAVRGQDSRSRSSGKEEHEEADTMERRDVLKKSASGSGPSKLREVVQAQSSIRQDPQLGLGNEGPSSPAQEETQVQGERDDMSAQWGSPFKVQWIRVKKLPFIRTRHLRNPWNHEREVKVSRDGTEIEPSVGQTLLDEWDKEEPSAPPSATAIGFTGGSGSASTSAAGRRSTHYRGAHSSEQVTATGESHSQKQRLR